MKGAICLILCASLLYSPCVPLRAQSAGEAKPAPAAPGQESAQNPPAKPAGQAPQNAEPAPASAPAATLPAASPAVPSSVPAATPPAASAPAPAAGPKGFMLEDSTPVKLRTTRDLSSATETTGQQVDFEVTEDVKVNNVVVIPQGGVAWGTVTEAQHKRHLGRGGKLNISIEKVRLADGEKVALRAVKDTQGGGHVGAMTTGMVVTGIVFFPVAPLFLFVHGKDITIPKDTQVTAYISGDFPLDPTRFGVAPAAPASAPAAQTDVAASAPAAAPASAPAGTAVAATPPALTTADANSGAVDIKSTPDGAEITVDGKFMGTTPSLLRLPAGDHTIRLERTGFKPWEKVLTVSGGGSTSLGPTLEPQ